MSYEHCCECDAHTGRAGAGDGSLYAGDWGPYCEECWYDLPGNLVDKYTALETENAQLRAELAALREQEPVAWIVEHDDYPTEVELHDQFDHTPEARKKDEAMGWRFTPLYKAPLSATQQENNNGN